MQFSFTDEQEAFRISVRRFMEDKSPAPQVRKLMATSKGYDPAVWQQMNQELGLTGIHIPERYGGQGFGFIELCLVMEEMGRAVFCAPYFSNVLAATAILEAGSDNQKQTLLPALADGSRLATLATTETPANWSAETTETTAEQDDNGFRLNGRKMFVVDGNIADLIIVLARSPGTSGTYGLSLFTVAGESVSRRLLNSLDETRKLTRIDFDNAPAELLGELHGAGTTMPRILDQASVALASESVGGAQKMLDSALEYAQMRMQFGRLIGSFQAIKHKCADLLLEVELAKSAAYYAAAAVDENAKDLPAVASLAKACSSDTFMKAAQECLQIHGGIGFTWENDTHLYFKRAKSSQVFFGDPNYHRDQLVLRWET